MKRLVYAILHLALWMPAQGAEKGGKAADVAAWIDAEIARKLQTEKIPASSRSDDAEFLRRVSLDLTGRIPTSARTLAFLDSTDPDKRVKLIDELLASSDYGKNFGAIWRNLFIRRDANMIRPPDTTPLLKWLEEGFNANRGWDKMVHDILTSDGDFKEKPQGLFFILNGDSRGQPQANIATSSIAQTFMGVQMQCAECHNHPFHEWKQTDFWGIAAYFGKVKPLNASKFGGSGIGEAVATAAKNKKTPGAIETNAGSITIPKDSFKNAGQKVAATLPGAKAPSKLDPEKNYRPIFADWLTARENPYFARTAINRLWAHLFGRGFVNPLTDFDGIEASHPELLKKLSAEFVASGFDQKHLIRCICLSDAYQRSSKPLPGNQLDDRYFSHMAVKVMSPEALVDSLHLALESTNLFAAPKATATKKGTGLQPQQLGARDQFIALFNTKEDGGDATEFSHGIPQALYLMNQAVFNNGTPILDRLTKGTNNPEQVVEGMFLSTLNRRPTADEVKDLTAYIAKQKSPREGYAGVLWTLVNRSEFILNR